MASGQTLATFAADTPLEAIPEEVIETIRIATLDCLAGGFAGALWSHNIGSRFGSAYLAGSFGVIQQCGPTARAGPGVTCLQSLCSLS
jgi:hypothetical protein